MTDSYESSETAARFAAFAATPNSEKDLIWRALAPDLREARHLTEGGAFYFLDLGCGDGWLARRVQAAFDAAEVVGYDPSEAMIATAKAADPDGLCLFLADRRSVPRGSFDLVVAVFVTPAIDTRAGLRAFFRDAALRLAPGGAFIVAALNPGALPGRHAWFESDAPAARLAGARYETRLLDAKGAPFLSLADHYWPDRSLLAAARAAGLALVSETRLADPASDGDPKRFPYRLLRFAARPAASVVAEPERAD